MSEKQDKKIRKAVRKKSKIDVPEVLHALEKMIIGRPLFTRIKMASKLIRGKKFIQ